MKIVSSLMITTAFLFAFPSCQNALDIDASKVSEKAIDYFLDITKVPRPSYYHERILDYLVDFAKEHSLTCSEPDNYGNLWIDIPASKGYLNKSKVILQAHTDMVCSRAEDYHIDFRKEGIKAIRNSDTITADRTSLGADNGIGIGTIMAIAASNVPHGPIRALFTADEEVGLIGANGVDETVIDSDYLINLDNEYENNILYSSAGQLNVSHNKTLSGLHDINLATQTMIDISVSGLRGGHSGVDINKHRLSAATVVAKIFNSIVDASIDFQIGSMEGGSANNAIAALANALVAIPKDSLTTVKNIISSDTNEFKKEYPEENLKVDVKETTKSIPCISSKDSKDFISLLSNFPQGVIKMKDADFVQTSSNTGTFQIFNNSCSIRTCSRSCVTDDLHELMYNFAANDDRVDYVYMIEAASPGWNGNPDTKLINHLKNGYKKSYSTDTELMAVHAGLEPSWLSRKRNNIQIASIGPKITDAHTVNETLHLNSVEPFVKTILYTLKNI